MNPREGGDPLALRRAELLAALRDTASVKTPKTLAAIDAELKVLDGLSARLGRRRPAWTAPAAVALLALSAVALASLIRLPTAKVELEAQVSSLEFVADALPDHRPQSQDSLAVDNFEFVGGQELKGAVAGISSLTVLPGTRLRLAMDGGRCMRVEALKTDAAAAATQGVSLQLTGPPGPLGLPDQVEQLMIRPGEEARFCVHNTDRYLLLTQVSALDVSQVHSDVPPEIRTASILSGTLRLTQTGRTVTVGRADRLRFSGVGKSMLIIVPEDHLHLLFSGNAKTAEGLGLGPGAPRDLTPTLLALLSSNPDLKSLFGILTGAIGMIWAASRYFGWPSR